MCAEQGMTVLSQLSRCNYFKQYMIRHGKQFASEETERRQCGRDAVLCRHEWHCHTSRPAWRNGWHHQCDQLRQTADQGSSKLPCLVFRYTALWPDIIHTCVTPALVIHRTRTHTQPLQFPLSSVILHGLASSRTGKGAYHPLGGEDSHHTIPTPPSFFPISLHSSTFSLFPNSPFIHFLFLSLPTYLDFTSFQIPLQPFPLKILSYGGGCELSSR